MVRRFFFEHLQVLKCLCIEVLFYFTGKRPNVRRQNPRNGGWRASIYHRIFWARMGSRLLRLNVGRLEDAVLPLETEISESRNRLIEDGVPLHIIEAVDADFAEVGVPQHIIEAINAGDDDIPRDDDVNDDVGAEVGSMPESLPEETLPNSPIAC